MGTARKAETFASVWDALEPSATEAANMKLRAALMDSVRARAEAWKGTQAEKARRLGITQPRLNDLMRGRISRFSLDALANLAAEAGLEVRMSVRKAA